MDKRIPLFGQLEIETRSTCNRHCPECLRNSIPDREAVQPWFEENELPRETIERLFQEALALGFRGTVCLQHYNEPLQDPRIAEIGRRAKELGFSFVFTCTNADFMNEARAAELDGVFDQLLVALYMREPVKSQRQAWITSLFKKTPLVFTGGAMIATHFSPVFDVKNLSRQNRMNPCFEPPRRMVINHRGDMLLCCDDMIGHYNLGNIRDHTLEELWYSDVHQDLVLALQRPGGRTVHPHCESCPRV